MMRISKHHGRCSGLSLVELMVAITLGLLLTAGMVQLFNASKVTFQTNDAIARVQENGRFALETLKLQLRETGALGFCAGRVEINNHLNAGCVGGLADIFGANQALVGWEFSGTGRQATYTLPDDLDPATTSAGDWDSSADNASLPDALNGRVVPGSDVLVMRRLLPINGLTGNPSNLTLNVNTCRSSTSISLDGAHGLADNAIVLATNCTTGDLFQNDGTGNSFRRGSGSCAAPGPGNVSGLNWSACYATDMQAFAVEQVAFYIGRNGDGQTGLYRFNMSNGVAAGAAEEIIQGAENMQVLYGYSQAAPTGDGQSVNDWLTASEVPDDGWQQVIAVRLALSIRSPERADLDQTDLNFELAQTQVTIPGDGRIRQPFSTTIALRNRVLVFDN